MLNLRSTCVATRGVGIVLCYFFMNKFKDDHVGEHQDLCISVIFSIYLLHACYSLHQNICFIYVCYFLDWLIS
jgi:hypothetical protein